MDWPPPLPQYPPTALGRGKKPSGGTATGHEFSDTYAEFDVPFTPLLAVDPATSDVPPTPVTDGEDAGCNAHADVKKAFPCC